MSNAELSLKNEVAMYGVTIRKMPNGSYFRALQTLRELPESFIKELHLAEGTKLSSLLDTKNIGNLIVKLLSILPDFTIKFLSELMEIDAEILEGQLTPVETIEIVKKFWEINRLSDFFELVKPALQSLLKTQATGFNAQ